MTKIPVSTASVMKYRTKDFNRTMYNVVFVLRLQCSKCHYFKGLIISLFCQTFTRTAWHYFHSFSLLVPCNVLQQRFTLLPAKSDTFFGQHGRLYGASSHQAPIMFAFHVERGPKLPRVLAITFLHMFERGQKQREKMKVEATPELGVMSCLCLCDSSGLKKQQ